ncbi:hypothetical protein [Syntrophotalea carbinolica]|uniref:hypothetical protein n=1 Tax=Syntrophotalea carbinolica TaxID=19 RepID=UPI0011D0FA40|nr:hypothetical protein [Syntrophotalea carbinolica]
MPTVLVLAGFGCGFGLICGRISWWLIKGSDDNQQNNKPYVMPITQTGTSQRGGIIYTDEEAKNAKENERSIK